MLYCQPLRNASFHTNTEAYENIAFKQNKLTRSTAPPGAAAGLLLHRVPLRSAQPQPLTFPAPISLRNFCFLSSLPRSAACQLPEPCGSTRRLPPLPSAPRAALGAGRRAAEQAPVPLRAARRGRPPSPPASPLPPRGRPRPRARLRRGRPLA